MKLKARIGICGILVATSFALSGCGSGDQPAGQQVSVATSRPEFAAASAPAPLPSLTKVVEAYPAHPEIPKQKTASGLEFQDITMGENDSPQKGDRVTVHYTGWLANGAIFDSSRNSGRPFTFTIGQHNVIAGWDEGVATMKLGGKRILTIPPALAYGSTGHGEKIPPNSTLVFEVELLGINDKNAPSKPPATQTQPAPPETQPATAPTQQATGPIIK